MLEKTITSPPLRLTEQQIKDLRSGKMEVKFEIIKQKPDRRLGDG